MMGTLPMNILGSSSETTSSAPDSSVVMTVLVISTYSGAE
jgi:hypothetical protein